MCNTMQAGDVMQLEPVSAAGGGTLRVHEGHTLEMKIQMKSTNKYSKLF